MQKLKFEADIYTKTSGFSYDTVAFGSMFLVVILCAFAESWFIKTLIIVLIFIPLFIKIYGSYNIEKVELDDMMSLEINPEKIWIGTKSYLWKDIQDINIRYSDYEGLLSYNIESYKPDFSAGIENLISFSTIQGDTIKYKMKLYSPVQIDSLKNVIEEVAALGYLPYEKILKIYHPQNQEEHQKLKSIYNSKLTKN